MTMAILIKNKITKFIVKNCGSASSKLAIVYCNLKVNFKFSTVHFCLLQVNFWMGDLNCQLLCTFSYTLSHTFYVKMSAKSINYTYKSCDKCVICMLYDKCVVYDKSQSVTWLPRDLYITVITVTWKLAICQVNVAICGNDMLILSCQ